MTTTLRHRAIFSLAALALVVAPLRTAAAEPSRAALAESLFQDAKKLLDKGDVSAACAKFKASLDIEHAVGAVTALAFCHQKEGKTASAWAEYAEVLQDAKKNNRPQQETYAREQIAALEKVLRRVTFVVPSTPGLVVSVDGVEVPPSGLTSPLPFDPGSHLVTASAPAHERWEKRTVFDPGPGVTTVVIPALAPSKVEAGPPLQRQPENASTPGGTSTGRLILGSGVMLFGAAAAGVGGYLQFVVARRQQDEAVFAIREAYDTAAYDERREQAVLSSTVGITSMVLGGIALAAGVYLLVTSAGGGARSARAY
jgi:hypothetical protein